MLSQTPQRRGAETFGCQLRNALEERGHEGRIVYLYRYDGPEPIDLRKDDIGLGYEERHPLERWLTLQPQLLSDLRGLIRDWRPDVLHLNGARSVKYGALAAVGAPVAVVYRNIDSPRFWNVGQARQIYYRRVIFPLIDAVAGVSERTLAEVRAMYDVGDETVTRFIPNAVDVDHLSAPAEVDPRAELGIPEDAKVVLFFGKLTAQKRPDRWLEVMRRVKSKVPGVVGIMVGDGPQRAAVEALIHRLGLEETVHLAGYQKNVGPWIHASNLLMMSSDTEGIPAAVLEAGYLRVPSVAPAVGGMRECIVQGETGLVVEADSARALADATIALLSEPARLERMGDAAGGYVRSRYLMAAIAPQYEELYHTVCRGAPPPG